MLKKIVIGIVALVILLFVGLFLARNILVKSAVEGAGNYALKVPTHLESASLEFGAGSLELVGYSIDNPSGYDAEHFFEMKHAFLAVHSGAFTDSLSILDSLVMEGITLNLEQKDGGSNFKTLLDTLNHLNLPSSSSDQSSLKINQVSIRNVNVNASLKVMGQQQAQKSFSVNDITLHDVGGSNGAKPAEVIATVMKELIERSAAKGQGLIPDFGDVKGNVIEKATDAVTGAVKDVGKKILGGDK